MKRLRPRPSAISGSLRASTSRISPQPLVMKRFTPPRNQLPCSSWYARRRTACKSLPASGSVSTIAPVTSPRAKRGRASSLILSLAKALIVSAMPCRPKMFISEVSARLIISVAMV